MTEHNNPYILFEGPDGSGKSTMAKMTHEALLERDFGNSRLFNMPPSDKPVGALIRKAFDGDVKIDKRSFMYLMMASAIDVEPDIIEARKRGIAILDRHSMISGRVYQIEDHPLAEVQMVYGSFNFQQPSFIFFMDAPTEVLAARISAKTPDAVFETTDEEKIWGRRNRYNDIMLKYNHPGCVVTKLDSTERQSDLLAKVIDTIMPWQPWWDTQTAF